jgi:cysteinyl-tRNA synthetase
VRQNDTGPLLNALARFDEIFDVLTDNDTDHISQVIAWADQEGREVQPAARELARAASLKDADIERLLGEMQEARKTRNFARSDAIRAQLNEAGIVVEITKAGARWKRK